MGIPTQNKRYRFVSFRGAKFPRIRASPATKRQRFQAPNRQLQLGLDPLIVVTPIVATSPYSGDPYSGDASDLDLVVAASALMREGAYLDSAIFLSETPIKLRETP